VEAKTRNKQINKNVTIVLCFTVCYNLQLPHLWFGIQCNWLTFDTVDLPGVEVYMDHRHSRFLHTYSMNYSWSCVLISIIK